MPEPLESHVDLEDLPQAERLARVRHSAAHVLAEAMLELMPEAELGIGPPIDTGFYYDFRLPRPLTQEDLTWLEERMRASITRQHAFQMAAITRGEAEERWRKQPFKLDLLKDIEDWERRVEEHELRVQETLKMAEEARRRLRLIYEGRLA